MPECVLVIGDGMAGSLAALAARAQGVATIVASRGYGATALSTGALDLAYSPALGLQSERGAGLEAHLDDMATHRKLHPYGLLGHKAALAGLVAGYARLQAALGDGDCALSDLDLAAGNRLYASSMGTLSPAAAAFAAHAELPLSGTIGVVGFAGDPSFDVKRICLGLNLDAGRALSSPPHFVPRLVMFAPQPPLAQAQALDDPAQVAHLIALVRPQLGGLDGLLLPPVLGLRRAGAVRAQLRRDLGLPLGEALAHLPSVPGIRLQRALQQAVDRAGVRRVGAVSRLEATGRAPAARLRATLADGETLEVGAAVLCTGRFVAGGLSWEVAAAATAPDRAASLPPACTESLLGLPVVTELGRMDADSPHHVVRPRPYESHPLLTAGILVGRDLQPLRDGRVAADGLFAAGMVLGGFASRYALCADGVALCTGELAGGRAAAVARGHAIRSSIP